MTSYFLYPDSLPLEWDLRGERTSNARGKHGQEGFNVFYAVNAT